MAPETIVTDPTERLLHRAPEAMKMRIHIADTELFPLYLEKLLPKKSISSCLPNHRG
jgi:hypothetical protein